MATVGSLLGDASASATATTSLSSSCVNNCCDSRVSWHDRGANSPSPPQLLSEQGQYREAMDFLKKALKLEPATKVSLRPATGRHPPPKLERHIPPPFPRI